tara:strand:- start:14 stop:1297 length:1284 start_codon:yes stop_codon:yes gene_type:complete
MAVPTLTPSSQTSAITLPTGSHPSNVEDNTELPFQIYSDTNSGMFSQYFCTGAANQVGYTFKKFGGDVLDIEITTGSVFSAYEESVLEYSYILNIHQAKNVLGSALGATTGTFDHDGEKIGGGDKDKVNLRYPKWQFSYGKRIGHGLATEAGFGGDTRIYSASFAVTQGVQDYDLQEVVEAADADSDSEIYGKINNKKAYITRVWYKSPQAMWRFFGYYGGLNTVGDLASYGQFADDSTFEVIPAWQNKLQAMAFEDAIYTRNSHYSYEIKNNRLRLFPKPVVSSPSSVWFEFYVRDDIWARDSEKDDGIDGVNNMNTLPFENLPYENINAIGKQWIRRFALALSKETLGQIRSKFSSIPIPGEGVSLNGGDLITQSQTEQEKLREELKTTLEELTYAKLVEKDAAMTEAAMGVKGKIPYPVPIVLG